MPTITSGEALLWIGAACVGIIVGVFGNWAVTAWFRWADRGKTREDLFWAGLPTAVILIILGVLLVLFVWVSSLP